jgi:hypothetical protein
MQCNMQLWQTLDCLHLDTAMEVAKPVIAAKPGQEQLDSHWCKECNFHSCMRHSVQLLLTVADTATKALRKTEPAIAKVWCGPALS